MGAGAVYDVLGFRVRPARERHERGNAHIGGDIEHPHLPFATAVIALGRGKKFVVEAGKIDPGRPQPVIPPDGKGIALDQFKETLQDGLLQSVPRSAAVGIGDQVGGAALFGGHAVEHRRRQIPMPLLRERPHGCPVDFSAGIQARGHDVVRMAFRVDAFRVVKLIVAEQLRLVGMDRLVTLGKIDQSSAHADLVPVPSA